jgi:hypothetical protein
VREKQYLASKHHLLSDHWVTRMTYLTDFSYLRLLLSWWSRIQQLNNMPIVYWSLANTWLLNFFAPNFGQLEDLSYYNLSCFGFQCYQPAKFQCYQQPIMLADFCEMVIWWRILLGLLLCQRFILFEEYIAQISRKIHEFKSFI